MAADRCKKRGCFGAANFGRSSRGKEDKAAWWVSTAACARRCISTVREGVGHGKFCQIKAASGRRSALELDLVPAAISPRL